MQILKGLDVARRFFPDLRITIYEDSIAMGRYAYALHSLGLENPQDVKSLVRTMDKLGLGVKDGHVVSHG